MSGSSGGATPPADASVSEGVAPMTRHKWPATTAAAVRLVPGEEAVEASSEREEIRREEEEEEAERDGEEAEGPPLPPPFPTWGKRGGVEARRCGRQPYALPLGVGDGCGWGNGLAGGGGPPLS